jgi:hypothetical protein
MIPDPTTPEETSQVFLVVAPAPIRIPQMSQARIKRMATETIVNCDVEEVVLVVWRKVLPVPTATINA